MIEQCEHGVRKIFCGQCNPIQSAVPKHPISPTEPDDPADLYPMTHVTPGMARATDPKTSREAAASVDTGRFEQAVVDALRSYPDSSIQDVVEITGERYRSISPRFAPLRRKGLIYVSGKKKAAQTGRTVQTWRAA
jgi:hypothetical protein